MTDGGEETAVTQSPIIEQPDPTSSPQSTTAPTAIPVTSLQLRFHMTSTSDWAELALLPGIDILNFSTVETSGETTLAEMREHIIDLDQDY